MIHTQTTKLTEIKGLILEDHPYILPFEIVKYAADGKLVVKLPNHQAYYQHHFAELLQVISTLGSYCVALHMDDTEKKAFLAEKLRIRKLDFSRLNEETFTVSATPVLHNKRSAKAIITVFSSTEMLYTYEMDYTIFSEQSFQKVFHKFYREENSIPAHQRILPSTLIKPGNASHFEVEMGPYRAGHCAGHFHHYPIVPAVFIVDGLVNSCFSLIVVKQNYKKLKS